MSQTIHRKVTVANQAGIHTRPAALIVKTASKFGADFYIEKDGYEINGKSIIGVMTLAAEQGDTLDLTFEGEDAPEAAEALADLIENGFGEKL